MILDPRERASLERLGYSPDKRQKNRKAHVNVYRRLYFSCSVVAPSAHCCADSIILLAITTLFANVSTTTFSARLHFSGACCADDQLGRKFSSLPSFLISIAFLLPFPPLPFWYLCRFCPQSQEEANILRVCQNKARHRNLPMKIVDAEYQFDMNKLTLFFEAER